MRPSTLWHPKSSPPLHCNLKSSQCSGPPDGGAADDSPAVAPMLFDLWEHDVCDFSALTDLSLECHSSPCCVVEGPEAAIALGLSHLAQARLVAHEASNARVAEILDGIGVVSDVSYVPLCCEELGDDDLDAVKDEVEAYVSLVSARLSVFRAAMRAHCRSGRILAPILPNVGGGDLLDEDAYETSFVKLRDLLLKARTCIDDMSDDAIYMSSIAISRRAE